MPSKECKEEEERHRMEREAQMEIDNKISKISEISEKEYQEKVEKLRTLFEIEKDEPIEIWNDSNEENDDMEFYHESYVKWLEEKYINRFEELKDFIKEYKIHPAVKIDLERVECLEEIDDKIAELDAEYKDNQ